MNRWTKATRARAENLSERVDAAMKAQWKELKLKGRKEWMDQAALLVDGVEDEEERQQKLNDAVNYSWTADEIGCASQRTVLSVMCP